MTPEDMAYELGEPNAYRWTLAAFTLFEEEKLTADLTTLQSVQTATVRGQCPRCTHDVAFTEVQDAVAGEHFSTLGPEGDSVQGDFVPLTVECRCDKSHPGRPKNVFHGCGINFRIEVFRGATT